MIFRPRLFIDPEVRLVVEQAFYMTKLGQSGLIFEPHKKLVKEKLKCLGHTLETGQFNYWSYTALKQEADRLRELKSQIRRSSSSIFRKISKRTKHSLSKLDLLNEYLTRESSSVTHPKDSLIHDLEFMKELDELPPNVKLRVLRNKPKP
ncbi:MAG: hypothetical protein ABH803_02125 [Candidatus Micrarchaeota archaeon]